MNGVYQRYFENGVMQSEEIYMDGEISSEKKIYNNVGRLRRAELYFQGFLNGWTKDYFNDGSIHKEKFYKDGILEKSKEFSPDGSIIKIFGYN